MILSIVGESIADAQLAKWRKNPANKGRTCRAGLWNYSRHPNYFFEWLHWWFYVPLTITLPFGWLSLALPALMLYFLLRVTGIPYTEMQAIKSRGDDYREYQRTTSAFIPWFPKPRK
jgi:steroid 5-alpha reductase family enzyme